MVVVFPTELVDTTVIVLSPSFMEIVVEKLPSDETMTVVPLIETLSFGSVLPETVTFLSPPFI